VIPFRHATSAAFGVSGRDVHLTLGAVGEIGKPDVLVELRMDGPLLDSLATPHPRVRHDVAASALAVVLVVTAAVLALLAYVG
jgi:hypothetical protein